MKAVILAAGVGTRLRPLTNTCPKPMLPIADRPLLVHTLDWLQRYNVREVALNLHYLPEVVRNGLGDGRAWNMQLHYSYEPALLGTAGALRQIADLLSGWFDQTFLVLYGDMLLDISLAPLLALHKHSGAALTMALKHTTTPSSQGMVIVDATGRVRRFVEKPDRWQDGNVANAGVYVCDPAILSCIPAGISDFGYDILPTLLADNMPVYGQLVTGQMLDIGTPEAYAQAQQAFSAPYP